jgi:dicarboxylate transporter 10
MADVTKKVSVPELRKSEDIKPVKKTPIHYPFWFGGSASCFATFFTHPLDLGKLLRLCMQYVGVWLMTA